MSVICETSQSSIWASQQLLLLTHSTTSVFSVALLVNTAVASASGVAIARRSGWRIAAAAKLLALGGPSGRPRDAQLVWLRSSAPRCRSPPRSLCTAAILAV